MLLCNTYLNFDTHTFSRIIYYCVTDTQLCVIYLKSRQIILKNGMKSFNSNTELWCTFILCANVLYYVATTYVQNAVFRIQMSADIQDCSRITYLYICVCAHICVYIYTHVYRARVSL